MIMSDRSVVTLFGVLLLASVWASVPVCRRPVLPCGLASFPSLFLGGFFLVLFAHLFILFFLCVTSFPHSIYLSLYFYLDLPAGTTTHKHPGEVYNAHSCFSSKKCVFSSIDK